MCLFTVARPPSDGKCLPVHSSGGNPSRFGQISLLDSQFLFLSLGGETTF